MRTFLEGILSLLDDMEQGGASEEDGVLETLGSMIHQMDTGIQTLDEGIGLLKSNFAPLNAGIANIDAGIDSPADSADTLLTGADTLSNGANQLDSSTSGMNSQLKSGVEDAMSSMTGGEYEPISYMDVRNNVELVQFVIRIPGVEKAQEPEAPAEKEPEKNLFEKFINLF